MKKYYHRWPRRGFGKTNWKLKNAAGRLTKIVYAWFNKTRENWWLVDAREQPQNGDLQERETQEERGGSGGHFDRGRFTIIHDACNSRGSEAVSK